MLERVLVAYDDSEQSTGALEFALREFDDATLLVLTIVDPGEANTKRLFSMPTFASEWYEDAREEARDRLAEATELATAAGVDVETDVVVGRPAKTIVDYANEQDCDHIVTGSHGRSGVSRIVLGSVAETVVRRSPVPVTVVR
ncbi:universal stress protein [Haloarchaeobius iranensis]|uniref:Nucleotide-binding universal stress protein, UspA family n=1 Tax=Haloarchaeobius iranensis TaxID=996166 RepID=A0A1G9ZXV6_9EURY|nr:universal stress protein [Haloarchaeobius iranensis]SDN26170.1 Nucleotide-binding universal stress protein, UspA family [Haloarchaeobius iranensis]